MCFSVGGEDEQVIHVDEEPSLSDHISEGVIHEPLEGGRGVHHPEEHYHGLEEPPMGSKCSFPLVSIFDAYIVVTPSDVELGKKLCSLKFVEEVGYQWEGVSISDSVFIQVSVILAGSEFSILLLDEEDGRCLW